MSQLHTLRHWVGPYKSMTELQGVYMYPPKENSACKLPGEGSDGLIIHAVAHKGHWIRIGMLIIDPDIYLKYSDKQTLQIVSK